MCLVRFVILFRKNLLLTLLRIAAWQVRIFLSTNVGLIILVSITKHSFTEIVEKSDQCLLSKETSLSMKLDLVNPFVHLHD